MASDSEWVEARLAAVRPVEGLEPDAEAGLARFRIRRKRRMWMRTSMPVVAGAAAVMVLAFPAPRAIAERCVAACQTLFSPESESMPAVAPDVELRDRSGGVVRLSDFRGKPVLLNFCATWCPPCRMEMPWFSDFQALYKKDELVVLGAAIDDGGWKDLLPFLTKFPVEYQVLVDEGEAARKFGVTALPATMLIARDGSVVERFTGLVSRETYEAAVLRLIREKK